MRISRLVTNILLFAAMPIVTFWIDPALPQTGIGTALGIVLSISAIVTTFVGLSRLVHDALRVASLRSRRVVLDVNALEALRDTYTAPDDNVAKSRGRDAAFWQDLMTALEVAGARDGVTLGLGVASGSASRLADEWQWKRDDTYFIDSSPLHRVPAAAFVWMENDSLAGNIRWSVGDDRLHTVPVNADERWREDFFNEVLPRLIAMAKRKQPIFTGW